MLAWAARADAGQLFLKLYARRTLGEANSKVVMRVHAAGSSVGRLLRADGRCS
jgi:hypothetical protein